jgi:hypothetical protein
MFGDEVVVNGKKYYFIDPKTSQIYFAFKAISCDNNAQINIVDDNNFFKNGFYDSNRIVSANPADDLSYNLNDLKLVLE